MNSKKNPSPAVTEGLVLSMYLESREQNYFEMLGLKPDATPREMKQAYYHLAKRFHPDRFRKEFSPAVMKICERLFGLFTEAYHVLSHADSREIYLEQQKADSLAKTLRAQSRADDIYHAEALFLQGEDAYQKGSYEEAKQFFDEAHFLHPQEPLYDMLRTWLLYCGSPQKDENLREGCKARLSVCLRRNPDLARGHLFLGILWIEEGQMSAGIDAFQKVLRLEPNHPLALKALEFAVQNGRNLSKPLSEILFGQ